MGHLQHVCAQPCEPCKMHNNTHVCKTVRIIIDEFLSLAAVIQSRVSQVIICWDFGRLSWLQQDRSTCSTTRYLLLIVGQAGFPVAQQRSKFRETLCWGVGQQPDPKSIQSSHCQAYSWLGNFTGLVVASCSCIIGNDTICHAETDCIPQTASHKSRQRKAVVVPISLSSWTHCPVCSRSQIVLSQIVQKYCSQVVSFLLRVSLIFSRMASQLWCLIECRSGTIHN